jgi:hypothetical protein
MGSKRSLLSLTLALAVGLVIGCARKEAPAKPGGEGVNTSAALPPPPPAKPTPHAKPFVIRVGPKVTDVKPDPAHLSQPKNEQAIWVLVDASGSLASGGELYIEFEKPEIFPDAVQVGDRYRVPCQGIVCMSGPIGENASHDEPGYKYWQVIASPGGQEDKADGMIKIDP